MQNKTYVGIALSVIAVLFSVVNDTLIKLSFDFISTAQLLFFKPIYSLFWHIVVSAINKRSPFVTIRNKKLMFARIAWRLSFILFYMYALSTTSIALATGCMLIAPLVVGALANWLLDEEVTRQDVIGLICAFIGAFFIVDPLSEKLNLGAMFAVLAAIFYAMSVLYTKKLTNNNEKQHAIVSYYIYGMIIFGIVHYYVCGDGPLWVSSVKGHLYLLSSGFTYFAFATLSIKALSFIKATSYSYIEYTSLLWAMAFDYVIWSQVMSFGDLIGVAIIVISCVFTLGKKDNNEQTKS